LRPALGDSCTPSKFCDVLKYSCRYVPREIPREIPRDRDRDYGRGGDDRYAIIGCIVLVEAAVLIQLSFRSRGGDRRDDYRRDDRRDDRCLVMSLRCNRPSLQQPFSPTSNLLQEGRQKTKQVSSSRRQRSDFRTLIWWTSG
jgi:hypothetical protein